MTNHSQLNKQTISQVRADYISIYDFIEWARVNYSNYTATANDLMRLLKGNNIQLYRQYNGIKPSIDKDNASLISALRFIADNGGYEDITDIPF